MHSWHRNQSYPLPYLRSLAFISGLILLKAERTESPNQNCVAQAFADADEEAGRDQPDPAPAGGQAEWIAHHGEPGEQQRRTAVAADPFQRLSLTLILQALSWKTFRQPPADQPTAQSTQGIAQGGCQPESLGCVVRLLKMPEQQGFRAPREEGGSEEAAAEKGQEWEVDSGTR